MPTLCVATQNVCHRLIYTRTRGRPSFLALTARALALDRARLEKSLEVE